MSEATRPPFEVIEHPSDVGIRVYGDDVPELFEHAALGLCSLSTDLEAVTGRAEWPITATAPDRDSLLVAWLSEILWLMETEGLLFCSFAIDSFTGTAVNATGHGEPADPARHPRGNSIKAVTYHQLAIRPHQSGWITNIIFDV